MTYMQNSPAANRRGNTGNDDKYSVDVYAVPVDNYTKIYILNKWGNEQWFGDVSYGVLEKTVEGKKHFLRKPPAIAFDIQAFNLAISYGARKVEVFDTDTNTKYNAKIEVIKAKGTKLDLGWGEQIYLPMKYWTRDNQPPLTLSPVRGAL